MVSAGQQQWTPINENIENNDAQMKDEQYKELLGKPLDLDSAAKALGGIGAVAPEEGEKIAKQALNAEEAEKTGNEDIDWGDAYGEVQEALGVTGNALEEAGVALGGEVYMPLQNVEKIDINTEKQKSLEQGVFSPRIDSLVLQGKLGDVTPKQVETLKTTLLSGNIDDIDSVPESELSTDKKSTVIELLTESEKPENLVKYSKNFTEDFGSELKDFQNTKGEYKSNLDQTAYEMISTRYVTPLEGEVSAKERKLALDTAFKTALNVEIDGKQFDKENESFKQICRDIKNDTIPIGEKFIVFKNLLSFTSLEQGKGGKKQEAMYRKRAAEQILINSGRLERFNQLLVLFKAQEENSPRAIELAQELDSLREEAGITPGDASLLALGGELEVASDNVSENPTESA